jgi:hypothetical protein
MKKEWKQLARKLRVKQCQEMLQRAISTSLIRRTDGDVTDDILTAMNEHYARKDWGALCSLTWLVQCYPNRKFTPLLCELLDNPRDDVYMEAIADAFGDIADERSIPTMIRALRL